MIRSILTCSITAIFISQSAPGEDLLNFENTDTLHGTFAGYSNSGKLIWKNDQSADPIEFDTKNLRRIAFNNGQLTKPFTHYSTITLINGDILPCEILAISSTNVSIQTNYAGNFEIPRKKITSMDINPKGAKIIYQGPFSEKKWKIQSFNREPKSEIPSWEFTNFSLNQRSENPGVIINTSIQLPDAFQMSFKADMTRYNSVGLMFHADLKQPENYNSKDENKQLRRNLSGADISETFGSCLAIWIHSSSISLIAYTFDKEGNALTQSIANSLGQTSSRGNANQEQSNLEIRADRKKKIISVYENGTLLSLWDLNDSVYPEQGTSFGFSSISSARNKYTTKISDIIITPWNGVRDSAVSLQNEERDVALLTNGTDRFSGTIQSFKDKMIKLKSSYADMEIPADEIKSIHFAMNSQDQPQPLSAKHAAYRFYGAGKLTASPLSGGDKTIKLLHPILGELSLSYEFLSSIDYTDEPSLLDDWFKR